MSQTPEAQPGKWSSPFACEDLGGEWKVDFGIWEVHNGCLCHILPSGPDPAAAVVISGTSGLGVESLAHWGVVHHDLEQGGFETVHITVEVCLAAVDNFSIALDEWAVAWAPYFSMKPVLVDTVNASRGHEYADQPWGDIKAIHRVELHGEAESITFSCDGEVLFQAPRLTARPYRNLTIESHAGACIQSLLIEGQDPKPARKLARRIHEPIMAALVDFPDDILYAPFNAEMIDLLIERLAQIGCGRIYWQNTIRVLPEALGPDADAQLNRNLDCWNLRQDNSSDGALVGSATIRECFPFLPKAVDAAHKRGMELYAILKPFEFGTSSPRGDPSPFMPDCLRQTQPDVMMQAWADESALADDPTARPVDCIRLYKDDAGQHGIRPDQISVWISDDNKSYRRVEPPPKVSLGKELKQFPVWWKGGFSEASQVQTISINGLKISSKYFAVTVDGPRNWTFSNRIYRLCEVFDSQGRKIHTERNLPEHPRAGSEAWNGAGGFVFCHGFTTARQPSASWRGSDWIETFQAFDGADLAVAFVRDQEQRHIGTPSPAHPAIQQFWKDWIDESLDAGSDGVDLRIIHHTNPIDWANYGFGTFAKAEFEKRFGRELRPEPGCRADHVRMFGDMYTDFVRYASGAARERGKKMSHHISWPMEVAAGHRPMANVCWDWRGWLGEGLLDSITLKNFQLNSGFFDDVVAASDGVEKIFCPYLNCILCASASWKQQLDGFAQGVVSKGLDGLMIYEVASFLNAKHDGSIDFVIPGFEDAVKECLSAKN